MTKVYGTSDELIEFDGDFVGVVGCYGADGCEHGVLVMMSDGTVLEVQYGKGTQAIWAVRLLRKGSLFIGIEQCTREDAVPHSDVATFRHGIEWAYAATGDWKCVT